MGTRRIVFGQSNVGVMRVSPDGGTPEALVRLEWSRQQKLERVEQRSRRRRTRGRAHRGVVDADAVPPATNGAR